MFEEKITPATIATITFRVPLYQRPYAWEAKQVTQLLGDLYEAFQEGQTSGTHADYHIGILSIANTIDDKSRYDLIDGQQRITTLFLIGKAAQAHFPKWGEFLSSERLDLYGREADKRYLGGDDSAECNRRMVDAVRCANEFLDKDAADRGAFAEFIYEHAAFFLSEVPPTYELLDKNQQFVRMNNRGKQLEKHEILKVQLLSKIGAKDEQSKAFGIWNAMISCLMGIKNGQQDELKPLSAILGSEEKGGEAKNEEFLYTSMLTIPEFLLIALARSLGAEEAGKMSFKTDNLLATFSVLASEASIIAFTEVLQKQVELFRSFFIFLSKQDKYEFGGMRDTDTEDKDFDFGDAKIRKPQLIATQSFLYVSTQPQHWMIPAFDWCEKQSRPIRSDEFIYELERIDKSITSQGKREVSPAMDFEEIVAQLGKKRRKFRLETLPHRRKHWGWKPFPTTPNSQKPLVSPTPISAFPLPNRQKATARAARPRQAKNTPKIMD